MAATETQSVQNDDTDEEIPPATDRDLRALTEYMTTLPVAPDMFELVGENGNGTYDVDTRIGRCVCKDYQYRESTCKHQRRAEFATGDRVIPNDIDVDKIDPQLGLHTDGTPLYESDSGDVVPLHTVKDME